MLAAGRDTVLGDAAAEEQLFLTGDYEDIALADISGERNGEHGVLAPALLDLCCTIRVQHQRSSCPSPVAIRKLHWWHHMFHIAVNGSNLPCACKAQHCADMLCISVLLQAWAM
jgi:hypothetical protein